MAEFVFNYCVAQCYIWKDFCLAFPLISGTISWKTCKWNHRTSIRYSVSSFN